MSLADLEAFEAVADTSSFGEAARRMGWSQPAVSKAVARLEAKLERRLFRRTTRAVALTPDGEALRTYAAAMTRIADETRTHFSSGGRRQVRIGMVEDFAVAGLHRLLTLLMAEEPQVGLLFRTGLSATIGGMLDDGEIDVALVKRPAGGGGGRSLGSKRLVWVGHGETLRRDQPVPIVTYPSPSETRDAIIAGLRGAGRRWAVVGESEGLTGLAAAITAGLGVGAFSDGLVPTELNALPVDSLPPLAALDYVLLARTDTEIAAATATVIAELAEGILAG